MEAENAMMGVLARIRCTREGLEIMFTHLVCEGHSVEFAHGTECKGCDWLRKHQARQDDSE